MGERREKKNITKKYFKFSPKESSSCALVVCLIKVEFILRADASAIETFTSDSKLSWESPASAEGAWKSFNVDFLGKFSIFHVKSGFFFCVRINRDKT